jgi:hypothetical protein
MKTHKNSLFNGNFRSLINSFILLKFSKLREALFSDFDFFFEAAIHEI